MGEIGVLLLIGKLKFPPRWGYGARRGSSPLLLTPRRGFPPKNITYFSTSPQKISLTSQPASARSPSTKPSAGRGLRSLKQAGKGESFGVRSGGRPPKTHPKVRIGAPHHAHPLQKRGSRVVSAPYALLLQNLATGSPKNSQILLVGCFWSSCAGETLLWGKRELGTIVPTGACDPLDPPFWVISKFCWVI